MREADTRSTPSIEEVARRAGVSVSSARNYFSRAEDLGGNTIFSQLLLNLLWAARAASFRLHPFVTDKEPGSRAPHYQRMWEQREVGGFILTDLAYDDERVAYLQDAQAPFVLFGRLGDEAGYCWVDNDNVAGSMMAVEHLV